MSTLIEGTRPEKTVYAILIAISFSHLLNDTIQSLIPAIYPLVKTSLNLSFGQIGLITFSFQLAASLLQPVVGSYTDRKPQPFSLAIGMGFTLLGLISLAFANSFVWVLGSVALVGVGSAVFHPEASRIANLASGGKRGLAQSIFQVGGNSGAALGPLLAALIIETHGQESVLWFSGLALLGILILSRIGGWYQAKLQTRTHKAAKPAGMQELSRGRVYFSVAILLLLIFSKYFYLASMTSYFTFYMIEKFHVSVQTSQIYLFVFLGAVAAGTLLGGPIGDRVGRKYVIWASILGVAPFTLLLPYADQFWTVVLIVPIGLILASAFSSILVYAQELLPGKTGLVSGLFFGFAFGMGGIGSAVLGALADHTSIIFVYKACSFLPLIGVIAAFLPNVRSRKAE